MAGKTDKLESAILNMGWRGTALPAGYSSAWYVGIGLSEVGSGGTIPDETGTTEITEPSTNYSRQQLGTSIASATTTGAIANDTATISFGPATSGAWGNIKYVAFFAGSDPGDDMLAYATLASEVTIGMNQMFQFALSALTWTES